MFKILVNFYEAVMFLLKMISRLYLAMEDITVLHHHMQTGEIVRIRPLAPGKSGWCY